MIVFGGAGCRIGEPGSPGIPTCTGIQCDSNSIPSCYYPAWAPSGDRVLYVRVPVIGTRWDTTKGQCVLEVDRSREGTWLVRDDGSQVSRVFDRDLLFADWGPHGWVVFQEFPAGLSRVYVSEYGVEALSLERITGFGYRPRWSPDGRRVAFDVPTEGVYLAEVGAGTTRWIAFCVSPDWSPSGDRLACTFQNQLVIIDTTGTTLDEPPVRGQYPRWSPSGGAIAMMHAEPGQKRPRIWLYDLATQAFYQLSSEPASFNAGYDWNPSGTAIVFVRDDGGAQGPANGTLWTVDVSTREARPLTFEACLGLE